MPPQYYDKDTLEPVAKYPKVTVSLDGTDGNIFAVIVAVNAALKLAHVSCEERILFTHEAIQGEYDQAVQVCRQWVNVE